MLMPRTFVSAQRIDRQPKVIVMGHTLTSQPPGGGNFIHFFFRFLLVHQTLTARQCLSTFESEMNEKLTVRGEPLVEIESGRKVRQLPQIRLGHFAFQHRLLQVKFVIGVVGRAGRHLTKSRPGAAGAQARHSAESSTRIRSAAQSGRRSGRHPNIRFVFPPRLPAKTKTTTSVSFHYAPHLHMQISSSAAFSGRKKLWRADSSDFWRRPNHFPSAGVANFFSPTEIETSSFFIQIHSNSDDGTGCGCRLSPFDEKMAFITSKRRENLLAKNCFSLSAAGAIKIETRRRRVLCSLSFASR